eukprot:CAMPEP_0172674208 /NCGR_PEP_ID=MMETSP1074-20121228/12615_1 /TAXON_ID=2916 /ORGANISM="Ceratium fusus, Strain PA161109" /LENGTH=348 /DNA_ID=CAMNT_0013491607 /DNA_START=161 /DNA_END=1207 /DNA_ORIENTATION=-
MGLRILVDRPMFVFLDVVLPSFVILLLGDIVWHRLIKRKRRPQPAWSRKCMAFWKMSRPQNIPLSLLLVLAGAFGAGGKAWLNVASVRLQVLLCAILTVMVTTSSCIVNDYFDFLASTDTEESQASRPLVAKDITAAEVKRSLKWFYFLVLVCICLVDTRALRIYVLVNAVLTYIYTKSLKPRGFVWKNGCVSLIITLAIGLGAAAVQQQAAGALARGLCAVFPSMVITFCGIFAREIIMDVSDVEGDRATGIKTLAVVAGPSTALRTAQAFVLPILLLQLLVPMLHGRRWFPLVPVSLLPIALGAGGLALLTVRAARSHAPQSPEVRQAIELFPLPLAVAVGHSLAA